MTSFGWLDTARASLQAKMFATRKMDFEGAGIDAKLHSDPAIKDLVVAVLGCH
jgi:hypothetical protein